MVRRQNDVMFENNITFYLKAGYVQNTWLCLSLQAKLLKVEVALKKKTGNHDSDYPLNVDIINRNRPKPKNLEFLN